MKKYIKYLVDFFVIRNDINILTVVIFSAGVAASLAIAQSHDRLLVDAHAVRAQVYAHLPHRLRTGDWPGYTFTC